jgi:hypothetical protein
MLPMYGLSREYRCFTLLFFCEAQLSWELYSPCFTGQIGQKWLLLQ